MIAITQFCSKPQQSLGCKNKHPRKLAGVEIQMTQ